MGIFDGFAEGLASAIDDIRNQVVEQPWFGQQTTGSIELPQVEAPPIEAPSSGAAQEGQGVSSAEIWNNEPVQYSAHDEIWDMVPQQAGIEAPQMDAPDISAPSMDVGGGGDD